MLFRSLKGKGAQKKGGAAGKHEQKCPAAVHRPECGVLWPVRRTGCFGSPNMVRVAMWAQFDPAARPSRCFLEQQLDKEESADEQHQEKHGDQR